LNAQLARHEATLATPASLVKTDTHNVDSAEKPPLFGVGQAVSEMLEKFSLCKAPQTIFLEWVDRFGGVFNCSFLISWFFSAESM